MEEQEKDEVRLMMAQALVCRAEEIVGGRGKLEKEPLGRMLIDVLYRLQDRTVLVSYQTLGLTRS